MSSVACRTMDVVRTCGPSRVACCMLPPCAHALEASSYARTHARAQRASADALCRSPWVLTVHWPLLPRHMLCAAQCSCTASIAAEQCRLAARADRGQLQRFREGAAGGRDGEEPGCLVHRSAASLQGTPQRRRWALVALMLHRVCCALAAHICSESQLPRLTSLRFYAVCLLACLFANAHANHTVDGAAYAARASSRGNGLFAACCSGVRCACTGAPPPNLPSRAAQAHCTSANA
jgi:hypothetical protein